MNSIILGISTLFLKSYQPPKWVVKCKNMFASPYNINFLKKTSVLLADLRIYSKQIIYFMEKNAITELEQLIVNSRSKSFLRETAKWTKFLSIMGFIGIGIIIIFSFFAGTIFENLPNTEPMPIDLGMTLTITYLVLAVIYFFPIYYLFQFSNKMKAALLTKNDETLSDAFEVLKSHYKFVGVLTIIMLSLYALVFLFAMLGFAFT